MRISISKKIFTALLIFNSSFLFSAEAKNFWKNTGSFLLDNGNFYIEPYINVKAGVQDEYVYYKDNSSKNYLISELNWQQLPVGSGGAKAQAGLCNFNFSFKYEYALPLKCGKVYDSDWYNRYSQEIGGPASDSILTNPYYADLKTNFSISDCYLEKFYNWEIELNYKHTFSNKNFIKPFAQFNYSYSSYKAEGCTYWYSKSAKNEDGYTYYKSYTTVTDPSELVGTVLRLQRINYIIWTGFSFGMEKGNLCFETSFAISPYVYVESLDSHLVSSTNYLDKMKACFSGFKTGFSTVYNLTENHALVMETNFTLITSLYGNTYSREIYSTGPYGLSSTNSGALFKSCDFRLAYRFSL